MTQKEPDFYIKSEQDNIDLNNGRVRVMILGNQLVGN